MKISIAPISYYWEKSKVMDFYIELAKQPVDIVYLGETVCSKRTELRYADWLAIAGMLQEAGKEPVLSTMCLLESQSEVLRAQRICEQEKYLVEANDFSAVHFLLSKSKSFITGMNLNLYNMEAIDVLANNIIGWQVPLELDKKTLQPLIQQIKLNYPDIAIEMMVYGKLSLSYSARCFTARVNELAKDQCGLRCLEDENGIPVQSQDGQSLFTINGIQMQSGRVYNLLNNIPELIKTGVDVVRLSPQVENFFSVIQVFKQAIDNPEMINDSMSINQEESCNGYWHQQDGHQMIARFSL